jgi:hypothetical protein
LGLGDSSRPVRACGYIRAISIRRDKPTALCVLDPARAVRAIADALGREARRELVELVVDAWVDTVPEPELADNYAKALDGLAPDDLREVSGWPGTSGAAVAIANREFLLGAFSRLGDARRDTLRHAAHLRGLAAFEAGVSEVQVLATVLPALPAARLHALAHESTVLYLSDRLGGEN